MAESTFRLCHLLTAGPWAGLHFLICKNRHDSGYLRIKQHGVGKTQSLKENKFSIPVANVINLPSNDSTGRWGSQDLNSSLPESKSCEKSFQFLCLLWDLVMAVPRDLLLSRADFPAVCFLAISPVWTKEWSPLATYLQKIDDIKISKELLGKFSNEVFDTVNILWLCSSAMYHFHFSSWRSEYWHFLSCPQKREKQPTVNLRWWANLAMYLQKWDIPSVFVWSGWAWLVGYISPGCRLWQLSPKTSWHISLQENEVSENWPG